MIYTVCPSPAPPNPPSTPRFILPHSVSWSRPSLGYFMAPCYPLVGFAQWHALHMERHNLGVCHPFPFLFLRHILIKPWAPDHYSFCPFSTDAALTGSSETSCSPGRFTVHRIGSGFLFIRIPSSSLPPWRFFSLCLHLYK